MSHLIHTYMRRPTEQTHITEEYVSSPPALIVVDGQGDVWTLGYEHGSPMWNNPSGEFSFNVLRNGQDTGEFASRIEMRHGRVRIFSKEGFKHWTGRSFV